MLAILPKPKPLIDSKLPVPPPPPILRLRVVLVVLVAVAGAAYLFSGGKQDPAPPTPQKAATAATPQPQAAKAIAKNVGEARECLEAEKYGCALALSKRILLTDPGNTKAKAIREEVGRVQEEARLAVSRCMSLKDADCAQSALARLKAIDPSADDINAYERAITGIGAARKAPSPPNPISSPSTPPIPEPSAPVRFESTPTIPPPIVTAPAGPSPRLVEGLRAAQNYFNLGQWDKAIGEAQGLVRFADGPNDGDIKRQAEELIRRSNAEQNSAVSKSFGRIK